MTPWLLVSGDFTTFGGMDRANHALARHLALTGRDVHLVAHQVSPDLKALPGVEVRPVARPLGSHLAGTPLLTRAAERLGVGTGTVRLANGGNAAFPATWVHYLHAAHTPVAASARARVTAALGHRYYLRREARVISQAARIVCNSRRTADDVLRCYGVPPSRVHVVYYGVDGDTFGRVGCEQRNAARHTLGLRPDARYALFVGALADRRKGFDLVFDAWRQLCGDPAWDVDLLVAGFGAEQAAWRGRAAHAGLSQRIRFLGFRRDIAQIAAASDLLVHPARYEAYGLGVHEGICRGVPAIVSRTAGVAERYPAELAPLLLPDPPGVSALIAAARRWREASDEWRCAFGPFSDRLRARSWDDMASDMTALLEAA